MSQITTPIPVQSKERIQTVDVLRGFAIFGILLFNMRSFAGQSMNVNAWVEPLDRAIPALIRFFVEAKFYSLFSFLFGWGMAVQMRRAEAKGTKFFPIYLRRLLILLVFGTLHGVLLWTGDILRMYAIIGILMLFIFRKASPKTLLIAAGLLLLSAIQMTLPGEWMDNTRQWCLSLSECLSPNMNLSASLYATGTYWEVTQLRYQEFIGALWWLPCYTSSVFAMMLLGLYTGKRRLFANFDEHKKLFRNVMWVGLVVGLGLNAVFTYYTANPFAGKYYSLIRTGARTLGAPAMTLFYISGITLLFQKEKWHERLSPLAYVGRMALTNYITHSVVLTFFFYGYGLGLYGETDPTFALLLTIVVYLFQIRFSQWYFERYQFGPLEWGWRKLTYGRVRLLSDTVQLSPEQTRKRRMITFGIVWALILLWGWGLFRWSQNLADGREISPIEMALRGTPVPEAVLADEADAQQEYVIATPVTQFVDVSPGPAAAAGDLRTLAAAFDADTARAQIEALTAPRYAGRVAGSAGGHAAGDYIASQFRRYNLQPAGVDGSFFQEFPVNYSELSALPRLSITGADGTLHNEYVFHQDFSPLVGAYLGAGSGSGDVIWVNDCSHAAFAGLNVVDKIVFCEDGNLAEIGRNVAENGAAGLLLLADSNVAPPDAGEAFQPVWIPQPVPAFRVYSDVVEVLLAGSGVSLADLSLLFSPLALPSRADLSVMITDACPTGGCVGRNVLGVLPGRDPAFTDQVIVVGANYDSLGSSPDGLVWNGANTSASGIAVLLEIAHSWQQQAYVPRVTVLFVAWDAEEQDSLGAEFYAQHPQFSPESVLAFIQLDALGAGGDTLLVGGGGEIAEAIRAAADGVGAPVQLTGDLPTLPFANANRITWSDAVTNVPEDTLENITSEKLMQAGETVSLTLLGLAEGSAEIEDLLTRRAQAVVDGDIAAFLQTSVAAEQENDRLWYADAQSLSPLSCEMSFESLRVASDSAVADVTINLEAAGDNGGSRVISLTMPTQFRYTADGWFWAGSDLLWQDAPADDESPRFSVAYPRGKTEGLDGLGEKVATQFAEVVDLLGLPAETDARILLFDGNEALRASTAMSLARDESAATMPHTIKLAYSAEIAEGERLDEAVVHLALANAGVPKSAAPWLWDGLPLVIASESDPLTVQASFLTSLRDLSVSDAAPTNAATSWAAVDYLRENLGWNGLGRFITAFGRACQSNDCLTEVGADTALAAALRTETASFQRAWREDWSSKLANTQTALDELLSARSDAVLAGDLDAFLATVDRRTPNLLREETDWFADLSEYPVESFSLSAKPVAILADGNVHALVTLNYHLEGSSARWASGTSTFRVLFKRNGVSYRWAGVPLEIIAGDRVRVRYPAGQEELATALLTNAQEIYKQLSADMGISSPAWQTINLYSDENAYRTSVFLSYPNNDWAPGWSAQGHSLKLLLESPASAESYRPVLAAHLARQLLLQNGVQDEWLLTGGVSYLARGVNANASQMAAAANLYALRKSIESESLFDFANFPILYRLSEDDYNLAVAQAWNSVRYLAETYGQDALWSVMRSSDVETALRTATRRTLPEFVSNWQTSFAVGHSTDNWAAIAESFDEERALAHIDFLTSPELAGRQAGSPGADMAADYIAEKFAEYGLQVERQLFPVTYQYYLETPQMSLTLQSDGTEEPFVYREDFLILQAVSTGGTLSGDLVWIMDEDYTGMDLDGNIAVRKPTGTIDEEIALATAHGAGALLLVGDRDRAEDLSAKYLARTLPPEGSIPVLELTRDGFKRLLEISGESIASLYSAPPALFLGFDTRLSIALNDDTAAETANVFGYLPGSNPVLSHDIILVGAHYDHVGDDPDRRYSGANDNASGVATMLEIARLWQESGYRPERSVLFVAWGGQELGEQGSRYYIKNPLYPLDDVVAMLQLDAVAGGNAYHLDAQGTRENEGLLLYSIEHAQSLLGGRLQLSFPEERGEQPFSPDVLFDRDRIGISSDHDPFRDIGIQAMCIAWREADEANLDDTLANEVEPERLATAGRMTVLTIMMNAR